MSLITGDVDMNRFRFVFDAALDYTGDMFTSVEYGSYESVKTAFEVVADFTLSLHERGLSFSLLKTRSGGRLAHQENTMKYNVTVPYPVFVTLEVEADSKEEAEEKAVNEINIGSCCGNGGTHRLIGVTEGSIEVGDIPLEDDELAHVKCAQDELDEIGWDDDWD